MCESSLSVHQQNQNYQVLKWVCVLSVWGVPLKDLALFPWGLKRRSKGKGEKSAIEHGFPDVLGAHGAD